MALILSHTVNFATEIHLYRQYILCKASEEGHSSVTFVSQMKGLVQIPKIQSAIAETLEIC